MTAQDDRNGRFGGRLLENAQPRVADRIQPVHVRGETICRVGVNAFGCHQYAAIEDHRIREIAQICEESGKSSCFQPRTEDRLDLTVLYTTTGDHAALFGHKTTPAAADFTSRR